MKVSGIYLSVNGSDPQLAQRSLPLTIILIIIPLLSAVTLGFYKNRVTQMKMTAGLITADILAIAIIGFFSFKLMKTYNVEPVAGINAFIPLVILVLSVMAYRGIKNDEELVRSYDRLR